MATSAEGREETDDDLHMVRGKSSTWCEEDTDDDLHMARLALSVRRNANKWVADENLPAVRWSQKRNGRTELWGAMGRLA